MKFIVVLVYALAFSATNALAATDSSSLAQSLTRAKDAINKSTSVSTRSKIFDALKIELKKEEDQLGSIATDQNRPLRMSLLALNEYFSEIHPDTLNRDECSREKARIEYLGHPPGAAKGEELGEVREAVEFLLLLCGNSTIQQ